MDSCAVQGSGTIIIMAWGSERPDNTSSSRQLSNIAESEPSVLMMGKIFLTSSPNRSLAIIDWRARIQFMLPRSVLNSPLWARYRYGWERSQLGNVLVENRECTSARAVSIAGWVRSRKY